MTTVWKASGQSEAPVSCAGQGSPATSEARPSAAADTASWYSSAFSGKALPRRVPRSVSVVKPHNSAPASPRASPSHCCGPALGLTKPSKYAHTTPPKASSRPAAWMRFNRSLRAISGMPSATTKGAK